MSHYAGQRLALLTQHGKEAVIGPVLEPALGCKVERISGFDTDQLGTFTRDTPREGSQLEAARKKARIGMSLSGSQIGLASEGSFGPDPFTGLFTWNTEMLVLIDDRLEVEVVGIAQGPARCGTLRTAEWSALEAFATKQDFPAHQLVLRPQHQDDPRLHKGIADWPTLKRHFDACQAKASNGQVFAETDLRAFANPSRMQQIGKAAEDLLRRLQSLCPACATPGYWVTAQQAGLPCAACGLPTSSYRSETWQCLRCTQSETRPRTDRQFAEPQHCAFCNP